MDEKTWRFMGLGALTGASLAIAWSLFKRWSEPSSYVSADEIWGKILENIIPPGPKCPPVGTRVSLIGDSFAEGLGPQLKSFADGCAVPYHFHAVRGSRASQWQQPSWIDQQIAVSAPTVALISLGGNDFQNNPAEVEPAIGRIVDKLRVEGIRPLWISPLKLPFEDTAGVREMWKRAVGLDWFNSERLDLPRAPDNVHAYPSGYKTWAKEIWSWMNRLLQSE